MNKNVPKQYTIKYYATILQQQKESHIIVYHAMSFFLIRKMISWIIYFASPLIAVGFKYQLIRGFDCI